MNISSVQYFLVIVLLSSTWALKYSKLYDPYINIRPTTETQYLPCDEFLKTNPGLLESNFMVTYSVSFHQSHNINDIVSPFAKDYSKCVWCQQQDVKCIELEHMGHKHFCGKKTYYVGPMNESCVLPHRLIMQFLLHRKDKREIQRANPPVVPDLTTFRPPNGFPKFLHIPIGGFKTRNASRERRNLELCSFPDGLETASLECRQYPSQVTCTQSCAFGYTLQGGIQQHMKCLKRENVWRPVGFIECQPFVDCTVALSSGGNLKCTYMSLKSPPTCTVSCSAYEDKDGVPTNTHTCNIEGKWDPPLPFCAHPGQGLMLTTAPKKKLHD